MADEWGYDESDGRGKLKFISWCVQPEYLTVYDLKSYDFYSAHQKSKTAV